MWLATMEPIDGYLVAALIGLPVMTYSVPWVCSAMVWVTERISAQWSICLAISGKCSQMLIPFADVETGWNSPRIDALVKDGVMYVQAGGGVVADSDPEAEFQETVSKAKALMAAADEAVRYASMPKHGQ